VPSTCFFLGGRGFKPVDYVTFARVRRARLPADVDTALANVGTPVYLGNLVGDTTAAFVRWFRLRTN
jgi:hypothetical protein